MATIQRIGRFTIEKLIGEGAFGRVYRALDPNFRRLVALKVLISEGDPDLLERFRAEAGTTAALSHKNIVTVYGFDEENGVPFLQMELLTGKTLREVIDRNTITGILEKVEVMYQVAEGLQYAHSRDVVHCDMKPGNVMVTQAGSAGEAKLEVKIMDFGIARVTNQDGTWKTRKEQFAGTIPYMAPEQFQEGETTKLCDVFAFGTIFYEFLSGIQPFAAREPGTVMHRVITFQPAPLIDHIPSIPEALATLVQRLMSKEPELRAQDMQEVLLDLLPILQHLRQDRALELSVEIQPLMTAKEYVSAQRLVKRVLELDPTHREARAAWRDLQTYAQDQARRSKADSLVADGRRHSEARRFAAAISCFDGALLLDQREDVRVLRNEAKQVQENVRAASRLVAEARAEQTRGSLEAALEKAESATRLDPANTESGELAGELRESIRLQRNSRVLETFSILLDAGQFDDAAHVAKELRGEDEMLRALTAQLERARNVVEERTRAVALEESVARIEHLRDTHQLEDAEKEVLAVCLHFPGNAISEDLLAEIRELLAAKRRREAIAAVHQSAAELLKAKRYDEACALLREGLQHFREDAPMSALLGKSEALFAAQRRENQVAEAIARAEAQRKARNFSSAIEGLDAALSELGPEPSLSALRIELESEQSRETRAAELASLLVKVRGLLEGSPQLALNLIAESETLWGSEAELGEVRAEAHRALLLHREQKLRAQESAIVDAEGVSVDTALELAEALLKESPEHVAFEIAISRLKQRKLDDERVNSIAAQLRLIDEAIALESWELAFAYQRAAQGEFPDVEEIAARAEPVAAGRRRSRWARMEQQIRAGLTARAVDRSLDRLLAASDVFPSEPAVDVLWDEFEILLLSEESQLLHSIRSLESVASRGLSEPRVSQLLKTAKSRWDEVCDQQAAVAIRLATDQAEKGDLNGALARIEEELGKLPDRADLRAGELVLRRQIEEASRTARLAEHQQAVQRSIAAQAWQAARERLAVAVAAFPDSSLGTLREAIDRAEHDAARAEFVARLAASKELQQRVELLTAARVRFGDETLWKENWKQVEQELTSPQQLILHVSWLPQAAEAFPQDATLAHWAAEASRVFQEEGKLRDGAKKVIARCMKQEEFEAALAEARSSAAQFPEDQDFQQAIRNAEAHIAQREIDRQASAEKRVRGAIEAEAWEQAEHLLLEGRNSFPCGTRWAELEQDIAGQRVGAARREEDRKVGEALNRQDWNTAVRGLARQRPDRASDPAWIRLVDDLESRASGSPDQDNAIETLATLANEHRDFGELHSLIARLENTRAARREEGILAAEARIRELDQHREWDQAIVAAEEATRAFPDITLFEEAAESLRQRQATRRREQEYQSRAAELEFAIVEQHWDDAERLLAEAAQSGSGARFAEFAARIETHRGEAEIAALETTFHSLLDGRKLEDAAQLLTQTKSKYSQHRAWLKLRKILDKHSSYEAGLQQAEKALAARENSRAKGILKWLVKDALDSRAKDLMLKAERAAPRRTRSQP